MENEAIAPVTRPVKKSGLQLPIKIAICVVVLILIGFGLALATRVWDPLWNPFRPTPQKIMSDMMTKTQELKTIHSDAKINITVPQILNGPISINFGGDSDINDLANPKASFALDVLQTDNTNPANSISLKANGIVIGKDGYVDLTDANVGPFASFLLDSGINLDTIKGIWFKVPAAEQIAGTTTQLSQPDTAALTAKIRQFVVQDKIYTVKKQLADEVINGQNVYHYLIVLNNDNVAKLFSDIASEAIKESGDKNSDPASEAFAVGAMKGVVSEFLDKIGEVDMDFYIGKRDSMLYRYKVAKSIDLSVLSSYLSGTLIFSAEDDNSKFNQPVVIEAPAQFKNLNDMFPAVSPTPSSRTRTTSPSAQQNYIPYFSSSLLQGVQNLLK